MTRKRGLIAGIGALVAAAALTLGGATAAAAPQPVPTQGTVHLQKLAQPETLGDHADGLPKTGLSGGIDGVTFAAYLVPGIDLGTNAGQQAALAATPGAAWTAIENAGTPTPAQTRQTAGGGVANFVNLPRGLYLFRETVTPAGVTAAPDFLVAVPLTDPSTGTDWLTDIYVYPKNARIGAEKSVANAADYVTGSTVTWTIDTKIPRVQNAAGDGFAAPDAFAIHDTLDNTQLSTTAAAVNVTVPAGLTKGTGADGDYNVALNTSVAGQTTVEIVFTADGRAKLAAAVNAATPNDTLTVTLDTTVLASGVITNQAEIFPNQASITGDTPLVTNVPEVRYGAYAVDKLSSDAALNVDGADGNPLAGAEFRVYLTRAAAQAGGSDYLAPASNATGLWTTDNSGRILIDGLRDSDYADGAVQNVGDPAYQSYWLVEVKALAGHQLLAEPVEFAVSRSTGGATADQEIVNQKTEGGFQLPLTGGTGTTALTVGGLLIPRIVLVVARRRPRDIAP